MIHLGAPALLPPTPEQCRRPLSSAATSPGHPGIWTRQPDLLETAKFRTISPLLTSGRKVPGRVERPSKPPRPPVVDSDRAMTKQPPPLLRQPARSSTPAPLGLEGGVTVPGAVPGAVTVAAAAPGAATTRRRQHLLLLLAHPALRCPLAPWPPTTCASTWTETG